MSNKIFFSVTKQIHHLLAPCVFIFDSRNIKTSISLYALNCFRAQGLRQVSRSLGFLIQGKYIYECFELRKQMKIFFRMRANNSEHRFILGQTWDLSSEYFF